MAQPAPSDTDITAAPFTITTTDGATLSCDARYAAHADAPLPVIVVLHGFKGFKDWGSFPYICTQLARHGLYVISFNFSRNGVEGNSQEFTRLDLFEQNTFSREVQETLQVIETIAAGRIPAPERAATDRIGMLGHSRGGGVAILAAAQTPRVRALATWAAVASFHRYTERQKEEWRRLGVLESRNMRTGQMMRLGLGLLEDLEQNAAALDIGAAAARLERPFLIVHGEQDISVRIQDAEELARRADGARTQYVPIPRTNHTFGAVHPFAGTTEALENAIEQTAGFFARHLSTPSQ